MDELNYEQKMVKSMIKIRRLRPFYSAIYESLEKYEDESIQTMGVTTNKLAYNRKFIESLSDEQLLFVNLHEIGHVALMHVARRENRDPILWNIACDLYVNKSLVEEFSLIIGRQSQVAPSTYMEPMEGLMYCDSIDLDADYTELIYDELYKQAKNNGYFSGKPGQYSFEYQGSKEDDGRFTRNNNSSYNKFETTIVLDSSGASFSKDLIDDGSDQAEKEYKSRKLLSDAHVRSELRGSLAGEGTSNIERQSKEMLTPKLDWRKLFKRYLTEYISADSSFSMPDKRMHWQKAIYPGKSMEINNHIDNIKVCIDVSGSISAEDLGDFFNHVKDIIKQFKVDAELIYWDGEVKSLGKFSSNREFERVECYGGGGTQPEVVFEYFESKKIKPRVTLMFTDGYFMDKALENINSKKYKDTIWVMTRQYNKKFNPPFGILVEPKL